MKAGHSSFIVVLLVLISFATHVEAQGFQVRGGQLMDANGMPFLMRGINFPHAWFEKRTESGIIDIASTRANLVRVVLSTGQPWGKTTSHDVKSIIELAKHSKLIVMLEVHNTTGYGGREGAMHLAETIPYWIGLKEILAGQEAYVLINLGNEPTSSRVPTASYVEMNIGAIKALRAAGLKHTFVVDGHDWGQDNSGAMRDNASTIFAADPLGNTVFSVHMYQKYGEADAIISYFRAFKDLGLALIVGEFGPDHHGEPVDEDTLMRAARSMEVGYIAWSWSGNSKKAQNLDIVRDFDPKQLTAWGKRLIDGADGIRATSAPASIFE